MKKFAYLATAALAAAMTCQTTFAQEKDNVSRRQPDNQAVPAVPGAQGDRDRAQSGQGATGAAAGAAADAHAQPAGAHAQGNMDAMWVREAAIGGMFEVQVSQLAVQKAQSPEIKQFAQRLIDDHTKANQQLMQIAQTKKLEVPTALDQAHQEKLAKMQQKSGAMFDKHWIAHQTAHHVHDILSYRDASTDLKDDDLKKFAASQIPILQQHYQQAARLANFTAPSEARPAGASDRASDPSRPGATGDTPSTPDATRSGATPGSSGSGTSGSGSGTSGSGTGGAGTGTGGSSK